MAGDDKIKDLRDDPSVSPYLGEKTESDGQFQDLRDNPETAQYLDNQDNQQQYQDKQQSSSTSVRNTADAAVGALLYKNAPKNSILRGVQSRVRLARQKGFEFMKNPAKAVKGFFGGRRQQAAERAGKRLGNVISQSDLKSPEELTKHIKSLPREQRSSLSRAQQRFGDTGKLFNSQEAISEPPLAAPGVEAPPVITPAGAPPVVPPPVIAPPVVPPPVADQAAANLGKNLAGQGLKGVEQKAVQAAGTKVATRAAAEGGKAVAKGAATAGAEKAAVSLGAKALASAIGAGLTLGWSLVVQAGLWLVTSKKGRKALLWALIFLAVVILLPAIILIFMAFMKISPEDLPTTADERQNVDTLVATFGDQAAIRKTVLNDTTDLVASLEKAKTRADSKYSGEKATSAKAAVSKIIGQLQIVKNLTDNAVRAKTASDIAATIQKLNEDYPEMMGFGKNCADLAAYTTGDKKSQLDMKYPADRALLASGRLKRSNGNGAVINASPYLCSTLAYLLNNGYSLRVSALTNGHGQFTKSGNTSPHYNGRGIDISIINGEKVWWTSSNTKAFMEMLYVNRESLGITQIYGPHYSWKGGSSTPNSDTLKDHHHHVHITVKPSTQ